MEDRDSVMVRPNQIIRSDTARGRLTFLMFAQSEEQVKRRVVFTNFPKTVITTRTGETSIDDIVENVELVSDGVTNRYAVTVNTNEI